MDTVAGSHNMVLRWSDRAGPPRWAAIAAAAWLLAACATGPGEAPTGEEPPPIPLARVQTLERDGVTVHLQIPTAESAADLFGVDFSEHGIQPIWLRIENASDYDLWLLPIAIDPDYYSADEVALTAGEDLEVEEVDALRQLLRSNEIPFFHKAGGAREGYIFATTARGGRFVDVRLTGHLYGVRMRFTVLLPTQGFDYEYSELRQRYAALGQAPDLSIDELREELRGLPCCTTNEAGTGEGDPLNVVFVGRAVDTIAALAASGWQFTEAITVDSVRRMIGAAIAEHEFLTAPVSSLYTFGRKQDVALQRGRSNISQRNHMRLWLAPFRCEGKPVWVGQVSRDIGVKFTTRSPSFTTHVIDPVVDEAREYLLHSLLHHDAVEKFAFVRGVGAAHTWDPRANLTDDPYITDGMRLVVWISREPVPPRQALNLGWNPSSDPVRFGRGEYGIVPALVDEDEASDQEDAGEDAEDEGD